MISSLLRNFKMKMLNCLPINKPKIPKSINYINLRQNNIFLKNQITKYIRFYSY